MSTEQVETKQFQSDTKKVLDIVINSLYTDRDVFIRELVSNAADALEKYRHLSLTEKPEFDAHVPLEINIECDDKKHFLTITDTGIGMNKKELETNLGTIAHSGSDRFLEELAEAAKKDVNLIGQFGVGFYSAFMAGKNVRVQTRSWDGGEGYEWESNGDGSYTIKPCAGLHRGTKVIIDLKEDAKDYATKFTVERIVNQYSTFVPFPVKVEGKTVNTVQAIWTRSKNEINDDEYAEFYKFIGNAIDEPSYRLHFTADAPLSINTLLFVPKENFENMGMGRMEPGVNLYCNKILIDQHSENILPGWLRFLKGVVDSEDLPLNISRQALQDNALVRKLRQVITRKFLKFMAEESQKDQKKYLEFWKIFGGFIKEGVTTDFEFQKELGKLLRFESSASDAGEMISLTDYIGRIKEDQDAIYYINGPDRVAIESGPYIEMFKKREVEIIYTLEPIDDFVLSHLGEYEGKKLISADRADLRLPGEDEKTEEKDSGQDQSLDNESVKTLCEFFKETLGEKVKEVKASSRLVDSPAMLVNVDGYITSSMERIIQAQGGDMNQAMAGKKDLEINPASPLMKKIASQQKEDPEFAKDVIAQVFDNARIQAGLLVDPQDMVSRSYRILEKVMAEDK